MASVFGIDECISGIAGPIGDCRIGGRQLPGIGDLQRIPSTQDAQYTPTQVRFFEEQARRQRLGLPLLTADENGNLREETADERFARSMSMQDTGGGNSVLLIAVAIVGIALVLKNG